MDSLYTGKFSKQSGRAHYAKMAGQNNNSLRSAKEASLVGKLRNIAYKMSQKQSRRMVGKRLKGMMER